MPSITSTRPPMSLKSLCCKIDGRRRQADAAVKPGFYGVAVGGGDIDRIGRKQAAAVRVGDGVNEARRHGARDPPCAAAGQNRRDHDGGGHGAPVERGEPAGRDATSRRLWGGRLVFSDGGDARQERLGRLRTRQAAHRLAYCGGAGMLGGERRIGGDAPFDRQRGRRVELAVDKRLEQQMQIVGVFRQFRVFLHRLFPSSEISAPRALARRDITVPIGTPSACAISR